MNTVNHVDIILDAFETLAKRMPIGSAVCEVHSMRISQREPEAFLGALRVFQHMINSGAIHVVE